MEMEAAKVEKKPTPAVMNEHGNYPIWMNKREVRRQIGRRKRVLRKKKKIQS